MKNLKDLFSVPVSIYPASDVTNGRQYGQHRIYKVTVDVYYRGKEPNEENLIWYGEVSKIVPKSGYFENPYLVPNSFKL